VAQNATLQNATADAASNANGAAGSTQGVLAITDEADIDDLDGWPLSTRLRDELQSLDLTSQEAMPDAKTLVVQVGPREQIAPPLQRFAQNVGATTRAVVMKPFWNLVDYTRADTLFQAVLDFEF
jgi:hypothetical protein